MCTSSHYLFEIQRPNVTHLYRAVLAARGGQGLAINPVQCVLGWPRGYLFLWDSLGNNCHRSAVDTPALFDVINQLVMTPSTVVMCGSSMDLRKLLPRSGYFSVVGRKGTGAKCRSEKSICAENRQKKQEVDRTTVS